MNILFVILGEPERDDCDCLVDPASCMDFGVWERLRNVLLQHNVWWWTKFGSRPSSPLRPAPGRGSKATWTCSLPGAVSVTWERREWAGIHHHPLGQTGCWRAPVSDATLAAASYLLECRFKTIPATFSNPRCEQSDVLHLRITYPDLNPIRKYLEPFV